MATRFIPYFPTTISGQALLDNFVRTQRVLRYRDNGRVVSHIQRGMPLYDVELQERVGREDSANIVMRGECLSACAYLKDQGRKVDLVYIDPPFASGADYAKKIHLRRNPRVAEAMALAEQELDNDELRAFEEKMYGDIWNKEDYLNWMYENLMAIKSVMSDTASIYVHLDWHIGHYVKILMDEVFGEENFRNEIIWKRRTGALNNYKAFGQMTDTIYFYSKSEECVFNPIKTKDTQEAQEYIAERFVYDDGDGRLYSRDPITNPSATPTPSLIYEYKGYQPPLKGWAFSEATMKEWDAAGKLYFPEDKTQRIRRKTFIDDYEGQPIQNLWTDIHVINSQAEESVDYATQKPEALLERIIKASSNEGMVVADFFGGSGVTAAVAHKLGRRFITSDVNLNSIQTIRDRLLSLRADFALMEVKDGVSLYRNPVQTMDRIKSLIPGLRNEDSLDKFWEGSKMDSRLGMIPVYIPNLIDSTTRVLDIPMMNRILKEAMPELPDDVQKVIVYYVDITDRDEIEQFIRAEGNPMIEVELLPLSSVLDHVVVEDDATWQLTFIDNTIPQQWCVELTSFTSDRLVRKLQEYNLKAEIQRAKGGKTLHRIELSDEGLEAIELVSLDCTTADPSAPWHSDAEVKIDAKTSHAILNGQKTNTYWDARILIDDRRPLRMKIRSVLGDETVYVLE